MILPYDKALLHVGHNLFFDVAFIYLNRFREEITKLTLFVFS